MAIFAKSAVSSEPIEVTQIAEELIAIAAILRQSTVQIRGRRSAMGSGVIWQSDGWIVTNAHVVTGPSPLVEFLSTEVSSSGRSFQAQVIRSDRPRDLALLKIDATDLPAATIGDSDRLRVGELALAMGNPLGVTGALTTGIIHAAAAGDRWIQADIHLAPGNSGGILANAQGRVIGINSMIVNGLGFAIPSRAVQQFFQAADRPRLGVTMQPVRIKISGQRRLGFVVLEVAIGSLAALVPLQIGDLIWGLDGQSFTTLDALTTTLDNKKIGDIVQVEFFRGNATLSRSVQLQPLSPSQEAA